MLRLTYLPANQRWAFTFGDVPLALYGHGLFYEQVTDAIFAASSLGLDVRSDFSVSAREHVGVGG